VKRALLLVLLIAADAVKTCGQELTDYQQAEVDAQINHKIQELRTEQTLAQMAQGLRDHPELAPEAVAARIASHPDIVAKAKEDWVAQWNKDHPFSTAFDRPPAPDDYLDKAIRQAEPQKPQEQDSRIAALEAKIAQLEQQKSSVRGAPAGTGAPTQNSASQKAVAAIPLQKPNPASVLTRTLPDGRVMAIVGGNAVYYKNTEEAKAAIAKLQKELNTPSAPTK
jgi:hypothetical protein